MDNEYTNKMDRIRQEISLKYGQEIESVSIGEGIPTIPKQYATDEVHTILKEVNKFPIGHSVKIVFKLQSKAMRAQHQFIRARIKLTLHNIRISRFGRSLFIIRKE